MLDHQDNRRGFLSKMAAVFAAGGLLSRPGAATAAATKKEARGAQQLCGSSRAERRLTAEIKKMTKHNR